MSKKNLFTQIELTKIKGNVFDLSHDVKLSCKMGDLIPVMALDCVPGDKFNISCQSLLRFAPLVAPVMHRFDVTIHYFFCPNRLVWPNWEKFMTGGDDGTDAPVPPFTTVNSVTYAASKLFDYMGIPIPIGAEEENINALPFACFTKIYDEYYRDQNLINPAFVALSDGYNSYFGTSGGNFRMRRRAWEHDYFTSALPFAQKGAAVDIPLGDVTLKSAPTNAALLRDATTGVVQPAGGPVSVGLGGAILNDDVGGTTSVVDPNGSLEVEATTISDLRRAFKLQEFLERAARGGTRYIEFIKSMFGVHSSDKRLQRPEYITGVKTPVIISEVLNTTGTDDAPQGAMAGHGVAVTSGDYGHYFCEEHGWIIGIMSVTPKTAYQQGIDRKYLKINDRYDYYFEQFAHIGEQAIANRELYAYQGAPGGDPFGYIPRYSEYKFENNRVAGDFRTTLDFWHDGRQFAAAPALNQDFIDCVPDTRIFAVEDGTDYLWMHIYNKVKAVRKMAYYGSPRF